MGAMKPLLCALALSLATPFAVADPATDPAREGVTYIIPIKDMIERGLVHFLRRTLAEAVADGADAIIFDMDTPGGRLDATEEIIKLITDLEATTYTFVNPNAISAGAITAMATDHIYMSPNGRIGDAMPIMMSPLPFGSPQEMPDGLKEKAVSPTVALIRSAAQRKGHDPLLAEAMVRPELEYKIGDKVICPAGQLLTLTSQDALQLVGEDQHPLLSSGTVADMDELLETVGRSRSRVVRAGITPAERVARFIEGFPVSGLLMALGMLCIYIEFRTPGFGVPGIAGILCLAVWFWGHHVAGLAGMGELLIFLLGVTLLLIEIFIIPGFGMTGLAGITLISLSLLMAMVQHYPGTPWYRLPSFDLQKSVINMGVSLAATFIFALLLGRYLPKTSAFQRLMLNSDVGRDQGYQASRVSDDMLGLRGVADTALRPAGVGMFGTRQVNVVSRGEFIERGEPIVVAETHGSRIVVEPVRGTDTPAVARETAS